MDADPAQQPPVRRPDPARWIWYAFGGRLPSRYRGWILQDATSRHWVLRHLARAVVQLSIPVALVLLFLPGPLGIRLPAVLAGSLMGLFFAGAYSSETIEHRVRRAGYPPGLAEAIRARASQERDAAATVSRHEANARRVARRDRH
jgi:hypothetical protein